MCDFLVQAAGTAEEDVFGTLQFGEGIFDEGCGDRCADVGLVEGKTLAVMADQIDRGPAGGAPEGGKLAVSIVFRDELLDFMGKSDEQASTCGASSLGTGLMMAGDWLSKVSVIMLILLLQIQKEPSGIPDGSNDYFFALSISARSFLALAMRTQRVKVSIAVCSSARVG